MAREIAVSVQFAINNGNLVERLAETYTLDQTTAAGPRPGFMAVGTTEAAIDTSGLTPGIAVCKNIGTVDITLGIVAAGTYYPVMLLQPGAMALFQYGAPVIYARAAASGGAMQVRVYSV